MTFKIPKFERVKVEESILCSNLTVQNLLVQSGVVTKTLNINGVTVTALPQANYTLTFPNSNGTAGQFLATDTSGVLHWVTPYVPPVNLTANDFPNTSLRNWLTTSTQTFPALYTFNDTVTFAGAVLNGPITSPTSITIDNMYHRTINGLGVTTHYSLVENGSKKVTSVQSSNTQQDIAFKTSSTASTYDVQMSLINGTSAVASANLQFLCSNFKLVTPTGAGIGWKLKNGAVLASATELGYLNVNGTAITADIPQVLFPNASKEVVGVLNNVECNLLRPTTLFMRPVIKWTGTQTTVSAGFVYLANTTTGQCVLQLTAPTAGLRIHVVRADLGTTNPLIIDAATNYVQIQNVLPGYIVTQKPYQAFTLFGTGTEWILGPTLPALSSYSTFTNYLWTIPYAVGQFRVATLNVTYRAVSLTASSIVTFTGLTSFTAPSIPIASQNLFTNNLGVTLAYVQNNRTWFVCTETFAGVVTPVMTLGVKYSSSTTNNNYHVDVVGWGYVKVGTLEYTVGSSTPNTGDAYYWSMATNIPLSLQGGENYTLSTISQNEGDLTIVPLNLNMRKYPV